MDSSMKRFWALLLAASMILSIMSMTVSAAETTDSGLSADPVLPSEAPEPTMPPATTVPPEVSAPETTDVQETESLEQMQIESIEVLPLTLYPETCGQWVTKASTTFYQYNWQNEAKLKINFTDGTSETLREFPVSSFTVGGKDWTFNAPISQGAGKQWKPGNTYTTSTVRLTNKTDGKSYTCTAQVTIAETAPLVSLSVEPVTIYDGQYLTPNEDGSWTYDFSRLIRFRAEFEDGTVIEEMDNSFWYEDERYFFNIVHDSTSSNPWKPGVHSADISVMGQHAQMEVTI